MNVKDEPTLNVELQALKGLLLEIYTRADFHKKHDPMFYVKTVEVDPFIHADIKGIKFIPFSDSERLTRSQFKNPVRLLFSPYVLVDRRDYDGDKVVPVSVFRLMESYFFQNIFTEYAYLESFRMDFTTLSPSKLHVAFMKYAPQGKMKVAGQVNIHSLIFRAVELVLEDEQELPDGPLYGSLQFLGQKHFFAHLNKQYFTNLNWYEEDYYAMQLKGII